MKRLLLVSSLLLVGKSVFGQKNTAQTSPSSPSIKQATKASADEPIVWDEDFLLATVDNGQWQVHQNQQQGLVYVDFEALDGPFYTMQLKNQDGQIIWKDATIYDLPKSTIYELNTVPFAKGQYTLELLRQNGSLASQNISID